MSNHEILGETPQSSLDNVTIFIAAGGLGTRARPAIGNKPKALIDLGDKSVLYRLCQNLGNEGADDFVLCLAHLKDEIKDHVGSWNLDINPRFSEEETLLGPERAILQAIDENTRPRAAILPGDMVLPGIKSMADRHAERGAHFTLAATHLVTDRTPAHHVGRLVAKKTTDELVECLDHPVGPEHVPVPGTRNLTSLGGMIVEVSTFVRLCKDTVDEKPPKPDEMVDLKDRILTLAIKDPGIKIDVYAFKEEVIDLGEPPNILHAQQQYWE